MGPACLKVVFRCCDLQKRVYLFILVYFHASYSMVESDENNEDGNWKDFTVAAQQRAIQKTKQKHDSVCIYNGNYVANMAPTRS